MSSVCYENEDGSHCNCWPELSCCECGEPANIFFDDDEIDWDDDLDDDILDE